MYFEKFTSTDVRVSRVCTWSPCWWQNAVWPMLLTREGKKWKLEKASGGGA